MPLRLSEHLERDRPRERLWLLGASALTAQELLAILLGTGVAGRDALVLAGEALARVDGSVRRLAGRPPAELAGLPGVGRAKAARVLAALELGRRLSTESDPAPDRVRGPADVHRYYATRLRDLPVEEFHVLALGSQSQILADVLVTRGILNSSLVHPREVFRAAIAEAAAGIIVVHNHPSGDPTPSPDDRSVTRQLVDAGRLLDVPVYDHVVIGGRAFRELCRGGTAVTGTVPLLAPELARAVAGQRDRLDLDLLARAYDASARAHQGQKRRSGDDFVSHSVAVATILAEQQFDSTTIAAALLHDVVEDSSVTLEDIRRDFGTEIAGLVDGLTKLSSLTFRSTVEEQAENYRKLLLSIAKDARVIIIKLADRLHNMRTLEHLNRDQQQRIALETREIYAPLAHRFGMARVKAELEDLAFQFLEPGDYDELAKTIQQSREERDKVIERLRGPLAQALTAAGISDADIAGRVKNLWSVHRKMQKRDRPFEEIHDRLAVRVLVNNVAECYHVLGIVHHAWTPLQERIKDYIASPKPNGYQSLHTTVFGPAGRLYEIQIRTREMHRTAEYGIAAHWLFKEGKAADELDHQLGWFRQLLELQQDTHTPEEFLEFLKIDLYQDEIFVFTPRGDVKRLPAGATPIDFAFTVHTEVGQHCQGARINGKIGPLHRSLTNGDTVEILTSPRARPSRDWLAHVRTARARHKIRQWVKQEEQERSVALGREILDREFRRRRLKPPAPAQMEAAAVSLSVGTGEMLEAAIGRGDVALGQVMKALYPDLPAEALQAPRPTAFGRVIQRLRLGRGIKIQGVDGLMVRYAQCCQPVPGDAVVGYVTQGRGISIHRADCPNLLTLANEVERRVEIDWQESEGETFVVRVAVGGEDRRGLYADICEAVSGTGTNIRSTELSSRDGTVYGALLVEVENQTHLNKVLHAVRRVKGVTEVSRRDSGAQMEGPAV